MSERLRLTKRFHGGLTEAAHRRLRRLSRNHGLSLNQTLCAVFENIDTLAEPEALERTLARFAATHGRGGMAAGEEKE